MNINKKAFSLLEVIISMLILAVVTAGSFGLFVTSQKILKENERYLSAVEHAAGLLDELNKYVSASPLEPPNSDIVFAEGTRDNLRELLGIEKPPVIKEWSFEVKSRDTDTGLQEVTVRFSTEDL